MDWPTVSLASFTVGRGESCVEIAVVGRYKGDSLGDVLGYTAGHKSI